jgi:hypothetical protein
MKLLFIYPLLAVLLSASCGTSKESTKNTSTESTATDSKANNTAKVESSSTTTNNSTNEIVAVNSVDSYRLIVSFISIGEGIDSKARQSLDSMLNSWKEKKNKEIIAEMMPWGREGEVDYCFKLNELSAQEQTDLVNEVMTAFKGNSLVQISENQPARHKR